MPSSAPLIALAWGYLERSPLQLACRNLGRRGDEQPGESAHQRAVDADVLQVGTDVALELEHQPLLLPAHDLVLDEAADLGAMLFHQRRRRAQDLLVDPRLDLAIGGERASERFQHRRDA